MAAKVAILLKKLSKANLKKADSVFSFLCKLMLKKECLLNIILFLDIGNRNI